VQNDFHSRRRAVARYRDLGGADEIGQPSAGAESLLRGFGQIAFDNYRVGPGQQRLSLEVAISGAAGQCIEVGKRISSWNDFVRVSKRIM